MNVGATSILDQVYLDDDDSHGSDDDEAISMDDPEDDFEPNKLEDDNNEALVDNLMASTAQSGKPRGVDPEYLSKIWRISHEDVKKTIDVTTQASVLKDDPVLSRNCATNDRMLSYKWIKVFFSLDTSFATKKGRQSSRRHTCCQLFVTDKGFIYVIPMKTKSEVFLAIKQLLKMLVPLILLWQTCLVNKCNLK